MGLESNSSGHEYLGSRADSTMPLNSASVALSKKLEAPTEISSNLITSLIVILLAICAFLRPFATDIYSYRQT